MTSILRVDRILEEVVVTLGRKQVSGSRQTSSGEEAKGSTDGAHDPRGVEVPARDRELVVVVEEIGLIISSVSVSRHPAGNRRRATTYHHGNNDKLDSRNKPQHSRSERPARLTLVLATPHDDKEADETGEAQDGRERGQEADGLPHGAEVALTRLTQLLIRKLSTVRIVQARAAPVQTYVFLQGLALGGRDRVGDPVGDRDGGDDHGGRCHVSVR